MRSPTSSRCRSATSATGTPSALTIGSSGRTPAQSAGRQSGRLAGVRPEDLIVSADGVPVADVADLQRLLVGDRIGQRLTLRVVRAGELREVELIPHELEG